MRWDAGIPLLILVLAMWFAPKIATAIDVMSRPELRRAFGGGVAVHAERAHHGRVRHPAFVRPMGQPHRVSGAPADRPHHRLGRADPRRSRHPLDRRLALFLAADAARTGARRCCSRRPHRQPFRMRCSSPVARCSRSRSRSSRATRRSGAPCIAAALTGCRRRPTRRPNCSRSAYRPSSRRRAPPAAEAARSPSHRAAA